MKVGLRHQRGSVTRRGWEAGHVRAGAAQPGLCGGKSQGASPAHAASASPAGTALTGGPLGRGVGHRLGHRHARVHRAQHRQRRVLELLGGLALGGARRRACGGPARGRRHGGVGCGRCAAMWRRRQGRGVLPATAAERGGTTGCGRRRAPDTSAASVLAPLKRRKFHHMKHRPRASAAAAGRCDRGTRVDRASRWVGAGPGAGRGVGDPSAGGAWLAPQSHACSGCCCCALGQARRTRQRRTRGLPRRPKVVDGVVPEGGGELQHHLIAKR